MATLARKSNYSNQDDFYIDYSDLDDFQRQLIDRKNNKSMVVTGSAGSGKSLIALHKAKQIAAAGDSYCIVVYTKTLRQYFEDGLKALGLKNVWSYHQWKYNKSYVKYMIVDECQDFSHDQIEDLKEYGQYCLFFGDTAQTIMNFPNHVPQRVQQTAYELKVTPDNLYWNYRITKQIAAVAEDIIKAQSDTEIDDDLIVKCKREGEKPHLIEASSFDGQLDKIAEIINNGALRSVGILLPYNTEDKGFPSVEYVKDYFLRKGITCEFKYNDSEKTTMDLDFHSSNPKIMTWWCAKGLQFKDVFIPCCEKDFGPNKNAAIYVAATRCSERLYLTYTSQLSHIFPNKTSSKYYNDSSDIDIM